MKILVFGGDGQLGVELRLLFEDCGRSCMVVGKNEVDVTVINSIEKLVEIYSPDVIINCAAYTDVDKCEIEKDYANSVNAIGARNVAIIAERFGAKLVYISSDFVFDGEKKSPYDEEDSTNPISVYGRTKQQGELFVKKFSSKFFIIRTSWLYGFYGNNFVKTMLNLAHIKSEISVVFDQVGSPTYARDLAEAILVVVSTNKYGVYHFSNMGECSWSDFANKIFEYSGYSTKVNEITSEEFGAIAKRPTYSVLSKSKFISEFNYVIPKWQNSLREYLQRENLL